MSCRPGTYPQPMPSEDAVERDVVLLDGDSQRLGDGVHQVDVEANHECRPFIDSSGAYVASVATWSVLPLYADGTSFASMALYLPVVVLAPAVTLVASIRPATLRRRRVPDGTVKCAA